MKEKGLLLVLGTAFVSGVAIFVNKFGVSVISPYIFTFLKNLLVAVMILSLLLVHRDWQILRTLNKKTWAFLFLIGLTGGSIPFLLFFKGLSLTTASHAAFIHKTLFIYVAGLAAIFLKERLDRRYLWGAGLLLLGNGLLILKTLASAVSWGDLLVLGATLLWAAENTLSKYVLRELPARIVIWARMFLGSLFIFVFLALTGNLGSVLTISLEQLGWVMITGVILLFYVTTWYSGLKYIPVSIATPILALGAPITTLLSLSVGRTLAFQEIFGLALVILGIASIVGFDYLLEKSKKVLQLFYTHP